MHGIVIKFNDDGGSSYSATFLPEVAAEQGGRDSRSLPVWISNTPSCRA